MPMTLVSSTVLTSTTASIEFTNIPQTGKDLRILLSSRYSDFSVNTAADIRVNNVSTSGRYAWNRLMGTGTGTNTAKDSAATGFQAQTQGNDTVSDSFDNISIYIANYTLTQLKSCSIDGNIGNGSSNAIAILANATLSTNTGAVTSIQIVPGASFVAKTIASLYIIS